MGDVSAVTASLPTPQQPHAGQPRLFARLVRAGASSVLATATSQVALIGLLWWGSSPTAASAVAFVAGAIPNYFVARRWAWGRKGKPDFKRELLPYLAVIGLGAVASVGLTTVAGMITEPLEISGLARILVLDAAFLSSYAIVFVFKFALLDRLVYRRGSIPPPTPKP
ncbi:GtrA family protein [Prauserella cavernicola]|uniref:GtrA family protein n=1 Tax=Prauserella cavernicola TaxID=2800127 RepID=A0A934V4H1_9PSEU|nr:GtrA family protein [Prauserella cavernicola]MBK1785412.1 GtrA family protein [Prauserella cavernicola]